jgi:glutaredoxin
VLKLAELQHVVYKLGVDFNRDEFYSEFGPGSTFPQVIVDDKHIGGCTDTVQYLKEQNLV